MKVRIGLKVNEDRVCFVRTELNLSWLCKNDTSNS